MNTRRPHVKRYSTAQEKGRPLFVHKQQLPGRSRRVWLLLLLTVIGFGLGTYSGRWFTSVVSLSWLQEESRNARINAWISPPVYTSLPRILLTSEDGEVKANGIIDVPESSIFNARVAGTEKVPVLKINGHEQVMKTSDEDYYEITEVITGGSSISLKQGWKTLDSWNIRVLHDMPPGIKFVEPPVIVGKTNTLLHFEAFDDYGVQAVVAHILPAGSRSVLRDATLVNLLSSGAKHVRETSIQDLTFLPWAGSKVEIQLEARDAKGHSAFSEKAQIVLPTRSFSHPFARALIEEREKLLRKPDEQTRDEAANVMAGIARESARASGDTLLFITLRTGAMRLVLDRDGEAVSAVSRLMWQAAARIEDTMKEKGDKALRQASKDKS